MTELANEGTSVSSGQHATAVASASSRVAEAKFRVGDVMRRWCCQTLGSKVKAIILTGSMARNEATWRETSGMVEFLSDAEFSVILQDKEEPPSADTARLICHGAEEDLRNNGVLCKLSFGAAHEAYLDALGRTIYAFELLNCGEVLYGDPEILLARARRDSHAIDWEDGWRLLANRSVELLEIAPALQSGPDVILSEAEQYKLVKLGLDMATSILVFKSEFLAGYEPRLRKLEMLHGQGKLSDLPFNAQSFVDRVRRCTEYKMTDSWNGTSPFQSSSSIREAAQWLCALWGWQLGRMHGAAAASPVSLLRLHMREQATRDRLRGWAYVVRSRGGQSLKHFARWFQLSRVASPRYCVYMAALELWAALSSTGFDETQSAVVTRWLPVFNPAAAGATHGTPISQCVNGILSNYHEFLVETNA
jgi:hypothetical protein